MKHEEIKDGILITPKGTKFIDYYRYGYDGPVNFLLGGRVNRIYTGRENLKKLEVTDGVKRIMFNAFGKCSELERAHISDSVTDIGASAFSDCEKLEYIKLPEGIKRIKESTFSGCKSLKEIEIPEKVEFIGDAAFRKTAIESIFIPASVKKIYEAPFWGCTRLKEITVDERNENYISMDGVLYTRDMKTLVRYPAAREGEIYTVPKGVEKLQRGCFYQAKNLKIVRLPDSLKKIPRHAFSGCGKLLVRVGWRTVIEQPERKNIRYVVM